MPNPNLSGYISLSPQGWAYVSAMPQGQFVGRLPQAVEHVVLAALALLTLAVGGALWVSRRIVGPVQALKQSAARMQAGLPVQMQPTGITECDEVSIALANAAESIQHARVELERQVAEAVERTRQAEQHISHSRRVEALGRLTGGVAHDFNNLLGVISNSAHLIRRHATQPAVQAPLAATLRAVEAGSRLTQHLLRFAGRRPLMPQTVTLTRWLPDMHEILSAVVGTRIEVDIEAEPDVRPLLTDPGELELALINLALNARDAMPGGGTLRLRARNARADETSALAPQAYVVLEVSDCGSGIEGDLSERVFEPFFTTKETGKGTGLGLSQVHGFCVQAGGTARLASTPDVGTTVTMILPAANANDAALSQPPGPALPAPPPALAGARVLLVEDNTELADVTAALLESYGARVRHATNAEQALAMLREQPGCDVVLSDVVMPGPMDGLALARLLRRERPELPVLLTTGYSMAARTAEAEFTVLRKPGSQQELLDALAEALQM